MTNVTIHDLKITHGEIVTPPRSQWASPANDPSERLLRVEHPEVRAVLKARTEQRIDLRFTYHGPSEKKVALASGEVRTQIGAKLRAADGCNLVYAMLRLEPDLGVVVQVKRNPNAHTHDDCNVGGYRTIKPSQDQPLAPIAMNSTHLLRASLNATQLRVLLDDALVWAGDVGEDVLTFDGPVGLRTDNGRFDIFVAAPSK